MATNKSRFNKVRGESDQICRCNCHICTRMPCDGRCGRAVMPPRINTKRKCNETFRLSRASRFNAFHDALISVIPACKNKNCIYMRNTCLAVRFLHPRNVLTLKKTFSETENSLGKARATDARKYARGHEKKKEGLINSISASGFTRNNVRDHRFFSLFSSLLLQRRRKLVPATRLDRTSFERREIKINLRDEGFQLHESDFARARARD